MYPQSKVFPHIRSRAAAGVFRGFVPQSFSDFRGHIAAVLFTGGCNWRCRFCYNAPVVRAPETLPPLPAAEALKLLSERVGFLEAVVISGGEPTLHDWVLGFLRHLRRLPFLVGLDTNGSRPAFLKEAVGERLVDRLAVDLKAPPDRYEAVTGVGGVQEAVEASVKLAAKVSHEIRLTLHPALHSVEDIREMAAFLHRCRVKTVALQGFKPWGTLDPTLADLSSYTRCDLERFSSFFPGEVIVR